MQPVKGLPGLKNTYQSSENVNRPLSLQAKKKKQKKQAFPYFEEAKSVARTLSPVTTTNPGSSLTGLRNESLDVELTS